MLSLPSLTEGVPRVRPPRNSAAARPSSPSTASARCCHATRKEAPPREGTTVCVCVLVRSGKKPAVVGRAAHFLPPSSSAGRRATTRKWLTLARGFFFPQGRRRAGRLLSITDQGCSPPHLSGAPSRSIPSAACHLAWRGEAGGSEIRRLRGHPPPSPSGS